MTKMIDGMSNMPGKPNWKKRNGPLVALVFKVRQKTGMTLSELARTLFETGTAYGMNHYFDSKKVTGCSAQDCPICKFLEFQSKLQK